MRIYMILAINKKFIGKFIINCLKDFTFQENVIILICVGFDCKEVFLLSLNPLFINLLFFCCSLTGTALFLYGLKNPPAVIITLDFLC